MKGLRGKRPPERHDHNGKARFSAQEEIGLPDLLSPMLKLMAARMCTPCAEPQKLGYVAPNVRCGRRGMPKLETKLMMLAKPCSVLTMALVLPFAVSVVPARAQDVFGLFRALSRPAPPAPTYQPFEHRPAIQRPKRKIRPKPVAAFEEAAVKKPIEPRPRGEIDNPVPALLADSTLQPGDMVMFPDGLRVFTGRPGGQHRLADFKPLSQAGKALPRGMRKLAANLRPSENPAWSTNGLGPGNRLAANTNDVETTGSVTRARSRGGFRPR